MATTPAHNRLRILFVDDEAPLREFMRTELPRLGHEVTVCADSKSGTEAVKKGTFDAAILDMRMDHDRAGLQVLAALKQVSPDTEAVIMTGYGSTDTAVEALRLGAFDYLQKPCKLTDIEALLLRVQEKRRLKNKAAALESRVQAMEGPPGLIGGSPAMVPVQQFIDRIGPTDGRVLITGETGTGKEVVARNLFQKSKRADMPFVPVNCGALNQTLAESQLFGHRKGSFTGADRDHKGFFEVANGGTVFLDELGELDKNIQVKLLRFLESGEIQRLGDSSPIIVDVRVVCATHRDLRQMIADGQFREDLLFRLNMFHVHLPPLRDRREDIPELARHALARHAKRPVDAVAHLLTPQALQMMLHYHWQGNVRELVNAMEYAWIVSGGQAILPEHLPHDVRNPKLASVPLTVPLAAHPPAHAAASYGAPTTIPFPTSGVGPSAASLPAVAPGTGGKSLADVEMEYILQVYAKNGMNKQATSVELGISLKTLYNKLHKYEEERRTRAG
ncbi:acetoacetate metabolism regulatory protein : Response regulator with CheY-like receiver, AAA-type ATPase, and DNA-binding domains OS=Singulisphaera acidiphila (strain ATCC BAA-1392 / DSM 18658 / VKM B-2454 / MOB10) GN=Sinac_3190 PE=4 SV=1: Response_reg: Sigma54_activat: HTH_8 [Gemmataceae bacterium]|nr:acetoacetate metabolism regulatory protein : Response regulator with CheY-like receiver, AAA-type ATPase, and DNA-binding domains OS=Singulisphaera acidiphila (strain ATCC BAA-1392 / DSM 18658 / VKM B-2454 / MOB10) GN=Sinac_3190 PE=4 SV=1: Response_reg: Sigma54_activat: HTH_8 [Gemmataceae bacterium]VTU00465.1 acetoacetate metabolism regulatory protein : Response regulator with CheY-like receiver, AAA-type ATPase, and DNA-binding domains OS=Singulisphaera acidiphila (strain ATCC BAA-1392 / DSM 1